MTFARALAEGASYIGVGRVVMIPSANDSGDRAMRAQGSQRRSMVQAFGVSPPSASNFLFQRFLLFRVDGFEVEWRQEYPWGAGAAHHVGEQLAQVGVEDFRRQYAQQLLPLFGVFFLYAKDAGLGDFDEQLQFVAAFDADGRLQDDFRHVVLTQRAGMVAQLHLQGGFAALAESGGDDVFRYFQGQVFDQNVFQTELALGCHAFSFFFLPCRGNWSLIHALRPPARIRACAKPSACSCFTAFFDWEPFWQTTTTGFFL